MKMAKFARALCKTLVCADITTRQAYNTYAADSCRRRTIRRQWQ